MLVQLTPDVLVGLWQVIEKLWNGVQVPAYGYRSQAAPYVALIDVREP